MRGVAECLSCGEGDGVTLLRIEQLSILGKSSRVLADSAWGLGGYELPEPGRESTHLGLFARLAVVEEGRWRE